MTKSRHLAGLVLLGFALIAATCGRAPEIPQPLDENPPPTSTEAPPSALSPPAKATPLPAVPQVADRNCPPMTGGAAAIQPHPDSADYSQEIADYLSAGGTLEELRRELEYLGDITTLDRKVTVLSADVTGDGQPDVVVETLWLPIGEAISGYAYALTCSAGRYVASTVADFGFTASFGDPTEYPSLGLRAVEDLTGDGVPELLLSFVETAEMLPIELPDDYVRFFKVVGWDGADFAELLPEQFPGRPAVTLLNGDGTLSDTDGDGVKELVLRGGAPKTGTGHPFQRAKAETWGWAESGFALRCATFGGPTYRFQAVEDGDLAMLCQDLETALASYQQAIFDEALETWVGDELGLVPAPADERQLLSAYSRYRILLIHLANGTDDAAAVVYDTLSDTFAPGDAGYPYVELAAMAFDEVEAGADLSAACREVIRYAVAEGLAPLADAYGYYSPLYATPKYLCPF